jgi:hypothetical protein
VFEGLWVQEVLHLRACCVCVGGYQATGVAVSSLSASSVNTDRAACALSASQSAQLPVWLPPVWYLPSSWACKPKSGWGFPVWRVCLRLALLTFSHFVGFDAVTLVTWNPSGQGLVSVVCAAVKCSSCRVLFKFAVCVLGVLSCAQCRCLGLSVLTHSWCGFVTKLGGTPGRHSPMWCCVWWEGGMLQAWSLEWLLQIHVISRSLCALFDLGTPVCVVKVTPKFGLACVTTVSVV